jgi:uncharacterized metal-binding protein YceD (DUF177 family)
MSHRETTSRPWSVPVVVAEIPEAGLRLDLAADEATRAALAKAAGLVALSRLECAFDLTRCGIADVNVVGGVSATVEQTCVVTLEPMQNEVEEDVDLVFAAADNAEPAVGGPASATDDAPEPLRNGVIDLGAVATEFLILAVDPYPRRPGAEFEAPAAGEPQTHPFAALAALKKSGSGPN